MIGHIICCICTPSVLETHEVVNKGVIIVLYLLQLKSSFNHLNIMLLHKDSPQISLELTYFMRKLSLIQRFKPKIFYFKPQKQIGQLGSDRQNNSKHLERIYSNLILRDRVRTTVFAPILVDLPGPEPTVVDEAQDVQHVLCRELKVCMFRDFGN